MVWASIALVLAADGAVAEPAPRPISMENVAYGVAGAGLGVFFVGVIVYGAASGQAADYTSHLPETSIDVAQRQRSNIVILRTAGLGIIGVGVAVGVAGALWMLFVPKDAPQVAIVPIAGGAAASWSFSW